MTLLLCVLGLACTELKPATDVRDAGRVDSGSVDAGDMDAGDDDAGDVDGGLDSGIDPESTCPPLAERMQVTIDQEIFEDQTWTCDRTYTLDGFIYVRSPAVVTIRPGTHVLGKLTTDPDAIGSALVVTRGARLEALGTEVDPVVFTSAAPVGMRTRGDWAGVLLLGAASSNAGENVHFEGTDDTDARNFFGGTDDTHDCGTLRYVRIEFGGDRFAADEELNGLTLAGCGSDTELDFIQVHQATDDAVEFFGGTADIRHLLITSPKDDGLDWDEGWRGRAQFVALQQEPGFGDYAIEADNLDGMEDALPRAAPTIYNMTLIGTNDAGGEQKGIILRRGTYAVIRNSIIMGFPKEALDIASTQSVLGTTTDELLIENTLFFQNGSGGGSHFDLGETDDDGGFNESGFFATPAKLNLFGDEPMLGDPYNVYNPDFVPGLDHAEGIEDNAATPPADGFFDETATYLGAFEPETTTPWTARWTRFPVN